MHSEAGPADLSGRVCLVTGASSGLGKEIARGLARRGAEVVLGVRHVTRGELARAEIVKDGHNLDVTVMQLDEASPENIRDFASRLRKTHGALHVLVNSASRWHEKREVTPEGIEQTWASHVVGPYLLTLELAALLGAGAPSRVINVVSPVAAELDLSDVGWQRRPYDAAKAYLESKQALRLLTAGLACRLNPLRITINAVSPGFVRPELAEGGGGAKGALFPMQAGTPEQGAEAVVWACTSPMLEQISGRYLADRQVHPLKFDDPSQIDEVERICARLVTAPAGAPVHV